MKLTDDYTQRLETPSDMQGHLPYLCHVATTHDSIVELGVRSGNSTCAFLKGIYSVRRGHLWSIDINPPDVPEQWFRMPRWSFLQADDMSDEALIWTPGTFDVLFIDTDPHSYEGCLNELAAYGERITPGGVILVHDTHPSSAAEPARALSEYTRLRGLEDNLSFVDDSHGLGVLRIPS